MYSVGDLILYGRTGVCRVEGIDELASREAMEPERFYVLKPLYQNCQIRISVDNKKVFSRPIISDAEARRLIQTMPQVEAKPYYNRNLNQLREHYRACMESLACEDLIVMTKSLYMKKKEAEAQRRKFGAVDERFMKEAEDLLFGEFAAALQIDRETVESYIADSLQGGQQNAKAASVPLAN